MLVSIKKLAPGDELPYLRKTVTFDKMKRFSAWSGVSPHTDEEEAKSRGLPTAFAQGMMSHVYMIELLTRAFGKDVLEGGEIDSKFVKSVYIDDQLFIHARVTDKQPENGGTRVKLELRVEDIRGETKTVATASLLARASACD